MKVRLSTLSPNRDSTRTWHDARLTCRSAIGWKYGDAGFGEACGVPTGPIPASAS
jgi:hypothetical protein